MDSQLRVLGYTITTDPDFQNELLGNTDELIDQLSELYIESQNKKNKKIIRRLTALIEKYPNSPQLKNFLCIAYNVQGNYKKAIEINRWILTEHPDYLFAKLNLANEYIDAKEPERVPEVLGVAMEIKELYPKRELFHLAEVTAFYKVAIRYYVAINNPALAKNRLEFLKKIAPDHPDTQDAELSTISFRIDEKMKRWKEEQEASIEVECARPDPESKQRKPPIFIHPEIKNLYQYWIDIPPEKLREILALNRETVIADLEKVLQDAVDRYQYFNNSTTSDEALDFPLHAICLLAELKAEMSLPVVLDFLENNEDVLEFWLGDHITATISMPLFSISQNSLGLLKQFLLKPGIYTYSRTAISEVLAQIATLQPQRRNEIETIYKDMFTLILNADLGANIIDREFLGLAIGDAIDCGFGELLPVIKGLYDKGYVSLGVNGSYEDVERDFKNPAQRKRREKIKNIFELYDDIQNTWASYRDEEYYLEDGNDYEEHEMQKPAVSAKIGRNDPCPCGSGQKYKKCCINK